MLTEVKSTTWPGDTFYRNSDGQQCSVPGRPFTTYRIEGCEEELQHDAMAAHAYKRELANLRKAAEETPRTHQRQLVLNLLDVLDRRAAEILAGWLGEERG